jgi:hypothetical protein
MADYLIDAVVIGLLLFALFRGNRLVESVRSVRKSARILKSEMRAAADNVDVPEPKVIKGQVLDRDRQ